MPDPQETRDMVISTASKFDSHLTDCYAVRLRNEKKLEEIDAKLNKIAFILAGIVLATHSADWVLKFLGH